MLRSLTLKYCSDLSFSSISKSYSKEVGYLGKISFTR
jgi:hypothetical protein